MIQEGLISMCLWGKRIRMTMKPRTSADTDRNQANSKKILLFLSEDNLTKNTAVFKKLFKTK